MYKGFLFVLLFNVFGAYAQLNNDSLIFHSNNSTDLEIHGATLTQNQYGQENAAYYFDGIDDYIRVKNLPVNIDSGYAFSFWTRSVSNYYIDAAVVFMLNAFRSDHKVKISSYGIDIRNNKYEAIHRNSVGFYDYTADIEEVDTLWHHLVGTWDTDSIYLYKDGIKVNSKFLNDKESLIFNDFYIGAGLTKYSGLGSDTIVKHFNGYISNARFYNKTLSKEEVMFLRYESPLTTNCTETVVNYITVEDTLMVTSKELVTGYESTMPSENLIKVYPNPTSDFITINSSDLIYNNDYSIELLDDKGKLLLAENLEDVYTEISIANYSTKGNLLFLVIKDGSGIALTTKKILFE